MRQCAHDCAGDECVSELAALAPCGIDSGVAGDDTKPFSIVIAALGTGLADGAELGALAAAYVLVTAIAGPLLTRFSGSISARIEGRFASRATGSGSLVGGT